MKTVWLVGSMAQYQALLADPPKGVWGVATNDFEVWLAEGNARREPVDLWSYLPDDALTEADAEAFSLCEEIGERMAGQALEGGVDLVVHRRFDLLYAFRALLLIGRAITGWIEADRPERMGVFAEREVALFWTPKVSCPDPFNAVAAWAAEEAGITAASRSLPESPTESLTAAPVAEGPPGAVPERVDLVSFTEGLASKEQQVLWDGDFEFRKTALAVTDQPVPGGVTALHPARLRSVIPKVLTEGETAYAFDPAAFVRQRGTDTPRVIWANPYIDFVWAAFSRWVEEGRHSVVLGRMLSQACAPRVALIGYSIGGAERCLEQGFVSEGVPVVSLDHWASKTDILNRMNTGCLSHIAVSGPFLEEANRRYRAPGTTSFAVGCLRRDMAALAQKQAAPVEPPRIVFITSRAIKPDTMTGFARPEGYLRSWERILRIAEKHPEWEFVVKPHPRSDFHTFFSSTFFEGRTNVRIERAPSSEVLPAARVVVLMNTPSWAFPEVAALGVPAVYLNDAGLPIEEMHMGVAGCPRVGAEDDFEGVLQRLLEEPVYCAEVVQRMQAFLQTAMCATGREAGTLLARALAAVAREESSRQQPVPAARVLLDLLVGVDGYKRSGRVPPVRGGGIGEGEYGSERVLCGVLDLLFRVPGGDGVDAQLPAMVRWVLAHFPKTVHPGWSDLRPYFVHAYLQAARAESGWRRAWYTLRVWIWAPGRIVAGRHNGERRVS